MESVEKFNKLGKSEFVSIFGNIFEKTEWIAEKCYSFKPYNNLEELNSKMIEIPWVFQPKCSVTPMEFSKSTTY